MTNMTHTAKFQSGVMLIEALIGILIFSIGILALIGMQAVAIKNTTDARYRSEAAFLANQIIGQMWVDQANIAKYDDAVGSYAPRDTWRTNVELLLPGVNIGAAMRVPKITVTGASNNKVVVELFWRQPGEDVDRRLQMINWINKYT